MYEKEIGDQNNQSEGESKGLTLDDLARMVQDGFAQTASQMASKGDLGVLEEKLARDIALLRNDMNAHFEDLNHKVDGEVRACS